MHSSFKVSIPYAICFRRQLTTCPAQAISQADYVVPVEIEYHWHNVYVIKRPGVDNFLKKMGVPTVPTETSLAVSRDHGQFEWAGANVNAIISQRWNFLSPRMWRLVFDIVRFNQFAKDLLRQEDEIYSASTESGETIRGYLDRSRYSDTFRNDYLIPVIASIWCTGPDDGPLDLPAATFVRFM